MLKVNINKSKIIWSLDEDEVGIRVLEYFKRVNQLSLVFKIIKVVIINNNDQIFMVLMG